MGSLTKSRFIATILCLLYTHIRITAATNLQFLSLQEIQSGPGPNHSLGIVQTNLTGSVNDGTSVGLIYFTNVLVRPGVNGTAGRVVSGSQTGHCVQVNTDGLACYFNFEIKKSRFGAGRILLEALFKLSAFPAAEFVVTGGRGAFFGIIGFGSTTGVKDTNGNVISDRINYNINFRVPSST